MKQEFKSYTYESKEYIPPIISEKKAALKSWLKEKITRISMNKGSINSGNDPNYTSFEIKTIRELFTIGQLQNYFPEYMSSDEEHNIKWKEIFLKIVYIFIAIKITIYILQIAGWKFALALFLIFWNIYLKRLWYVYFSYPIFGIRQHSDGLSEDEIWHFHTKSQSRYRYWIWDCLALPYLLFNLVYFILFYLI